MVKNTWNAMKHINYRLFLALLLTGLIPTLYTTFRIYLIGQLPGDWGFNIASQLAWVNVLYEVLQEAIILPLYFFIGQAFINKSELNNKIRTGLIFTVGAYMLMSLIFLLFANPLLNLMAQNVALIDETATYIRLESVAAVFMVAVRFILVVLVMINKDKYLYYVLASQLILTILLDVFLVSSLSISLNLGVNGIAISNILTHFGLLIASYFILKKEGLYLFIREKLDFSWIKSLIKIGGLSGLESFVRNAAFLLMVLRMVNMVGESGTFWVANNFIWGWLLLPIIQLGELVKRDIGENNKDIGKRSLGYFGVTAVIVLVWILTLPLWPIFLRDVLVLSNYQDVYNIVLISLFFYILFAFNNVIDSVFYGLGKTNYMLFQSLVINTLFYGTLFILFLLDIYQPTLILIALMFAIGIALDSLLTYGMFYWMLKKDKPIVRVS